MNTKRTFAFDFHVHTSYSFDSLTPPRLAIESARRRGLDGIAVTDHDTIEGARAAIRANPYSDFLVIPGIEVKTDAGDVIGLYLKRDIHSRRLADVIAEIHDQGAVAYMPHPVHTYGADRVARVFAERTDIDIWERYNGRYDAAEFSSAGSLFDGLSQVRFACGSDAHFPWEIGMFRTLLDELPRDPASLLAATKESRLVARVRGEIPRRAGITAGAIIKDCRRRRYAKVARLAISLPLKLVKRSVSAGVERLRD